MKYQEKVESAQSKAQVEFDSCVGDILDSTKEQQEDDCMDEGTNDPEQFMALDPEGHFGDDRLDSKAKDSFFKKIELDSLDYLSSETRKLDPHQRTVVDIGISYA